MICPQCQEEIESIIIHQKVDYLRELRLIDDRPYLRPSFTIDVPDGKPSYRFSCGLCGGELSQRDGRALLRQATGR